MRVYITSVKACNGTNGQVSDICYTVKSDEGSTIQLKIQTHWHLADELQTHWHLTDGNLATSIVQESVFNDMKGRIFPSNVPVTMIVDESVEKTYGNSGPELTFYLSDDICGSFEHIWLD